MAKIQARLSKRYARALFEAACDPKVDIAKLDELSKGLKEIAAAWSESAELRLVLLNPSVDEQARLAIVKDLVKATGVQEEMIFNLLTVVLENKRFSVIADIYSEFAAMVDEVKKIMSLEITSAFDIPNNERLDVEQTLRVQFGEHARVSWKVDPSILGGLLIKSGDHLIDGSISNQLSKAREALMS